MHGVLHATAALGGGITSSLLHFAQTASDYEHFIVSSSRGRFDTGAALESSFSSVIAVPEGVAEFRAALQRAVRELKPDIVHLHSAVAGLVGRALIAQGNAAVAYSPHSFYFERTNLRPPVKLAARRLEGLLARRTDLLIAVSPAELRLGERLEYQSVFVPNAVAIEADKRVVRPPRLPRRIVAVGRLADQKDPVFFAQAREASGLTGADYEWIWVGAGSASLERRLERAGVVVTGWRPRSEVVALLADADVYGHTAAWEGNPITLLEASALGVPVVVRSIPSLVSLGYPVDIISPADFGAAVREALAGNIRPKHPPDMPPRTLSEAYATALSSRRSEPSQ